MDHIISNNNLIEPSTIDLGSTGFLSNLRSHFLWRFLQLVGVCSFLTLGDLLLLFLGWLFSSLQDTVTVTRVRWLKIENTFGRLPECVCARMCVCLYVCVWVRTCLHGAAVFGMCRMYRSVSLNPACRHPTLPSLKSSHWYICFSPTFAAGELLSAHLNHLCSLVYWSCEGWFLKAKINGFRLFAFSQDERFKIHSFCLYRGWMTESGQRWAEKTYPI